VLCGVERNGCGGAVTGADKPHVTQPAVGSGPYVG
jgi:hypothetical protein